ncbi:MAG: sodium:proton antiporter [Micavibrio aeruginosavorus]|uniref:Iron-sulfur cluster carrier protein n=1 Tax=Micavibrio aeruginosavorus TaxID=349221 RepID=A0A2W5MUJ1_9BACT|nr:MAG: sodium:proton antiporter [Micavibrio aeruginosavorus]
MAADLKDKILEALSGVMYEGTDIVSRGMVSGLQISAGKDVFFALDVDPAMGPAMEPLRRAAENAVRAVAGIKDAAVVLTAERAAKAEPDPHGMNKNPPLDLPIKHIIAVGSGKGGVGKSTVAFNLAVALSKMGLSVGLLDADIYGPSVPKLSGLSGQKPKTDESGKIIPLAAHGVRMMSIGFMVEEDKAMIWRGPMVQSAVYQMLRDVKWNNDTPILDVLVVDMPPGTGDVQLTLAQKVPVTGAVIVSTPQDLALIDARKAIAMFEKTNVKILGLIENMSFHICENCGHEDHVFGRGGAQKEASKQGVPFLGEIPLNGKIREESDAGMVASHPIYSQLAHKLADSLK